MFWSIYVHYFFIILECNSFIKNFMKQLLCYTMLRESLLSHALQASDLVIVSCVSFNLVFVQRLLEAVD